MVPITTDIHIHSWFSLSNIVLSISSTATAPVRRTSLISEEQTQVQSEGQCEGIGKRKRRLTYVDDSSDDESGDDESVNEVVAKPILSCDHFDVQAIFVKRQRGLDEATSSISTLESGSYDDLLYDVNSLPAVPQGQRGTSVGIMISASDFIVPALSHVLRILAEPH